jgi:hypothetical protein
MPFEKPPHNPVPPGAPAGGIPYRVKTGDDWFSVAGAHGVSAQDLIYFNFRTHDPQEVNFYLRTRVGCVKPTDDRHNWMFSSDAHPGIIYLPPKPWHRPTFPPPPKPDPTQPDKQPERSGIWFGFGGQTGGHLVVAGKDTVEACLYSLEGYRNRFWMNIDGYRVGPGLGGSIGVVFVVATGGKTPSAFNGLKVSGVDFQANLGGRWGDLAKGVKGLRFVSRFAKAGKFIDKAISVAEWEKLRDLIYNGIKAGQISLHSEKPEMNVMGIPGAGTGAEVSVYYGWGTVFIHGVTMAGN